MCQCLNEVLQSTFENSYSCLVKGYVLIHVSLRVGGRQVGVMVKVKFTGNYCKSISQCNVLLSDKDKCDKCVCTYCVLVHRC